MQIECMPAKMSDAPMLSRIASETFALACQSGTDQLEIDTYVATELPPASFESFIKEPSKHLYSVMADQILAGFMLLVDGYCPSEVEGPSLELGKLYVLAEWHGKGVAAALMAKAVSVASDMNRRTLWLGVSKDNARGLAFYRKQGFSVVGGKQFIVGNEIHDDFIMSRVIGSE